MNVLKGLFYGVSALGAVCSIGVAAAHAVVVTKMCKDELFKERVENYEPKETSKETDD